MNIDEIIVVIAFRKKDMEIVSTFTDRAAGMEWYKKLKKKGIPVSIHAVELNTGKELIQEFGL